MDSGGHEGIIGYIVTGISSLIAGLGLPKLYQAWTDNNKIKSETEIKKLEISKEESSEFESMKLYLVQIASTMDMLIIAMQDHFTDNKSMQESIDKAKDILHRHPFYSKYVQNKDQ